MRIYPAFALSFACFFVPLSAAGPWDSSLSGSVYGSASVPSDEGTSALEGVDNTESGWNDQGGWDGQGDDDDDYDNSMSYDGEETYRGWTNEGGWDHYRWNHCYGESPCGFGHTGLCDPEPDPQLDCFTSGIFMPECPVLFKPLLADPRQVWYSVGWRFNDEVFVQNIIDVSFADTFPIYRWWNIFFCGDALQIELEGALWAVFDPLHYSSPLTNADYYGGVPITYAIGPWSFRLRFFHISSHIGDEFLLNHPGFNRLNPSAEYIDLFASYQFNPELRVYAGYGYIVQSDDSFPFKRNYLEWGLEAYFRRGQFYLPNHCLSGEPYFAMHFRARQDNDWHEDGTYVLGYEFSKHSGMCHKWRIFMQYHQGYSCEGQFSRLRTDYFSLRTSYWF